METLIEKDQQKNERRRGVQFSPEVQAYIQSQLNFVPGMNINSNTSVQQINQQARQNEKVEREIPKTRAEGSYRNIKRRRKSGKTKDQEDTERDIKLATQPTWRSDVADVLHNVGIGLSTVGGGLALLSNPITAGTALVGGTVGGRAVDKASQYLTGKTWAENVQEKLGLQTPTLAEFTNPGYFIGGGLSLKGKGILDYLIKADMPRFGYTPTTRYYFKPGYLGMNTVPLDKVLNPKLGLKLSDVERFYQQYGNASTDELVSKGVLKPGPNGDFIVMVNGRPKGSYKNYFLANRKQFIQDDPIPTKQEEAVKPLLTGKAREEQLNTIWDNAAKSIENLKAEHPIPAKQTKQEDVTNLSLKGQIDRLFTAEGRLEQPITRQELESNPELMKFVESIYKNGVPTNPETGEPIIATIGSDGNLVPTERLASLLAYKTGRNSRAGEHLSYIKNEPFLEGLRGTQPLLERETLLPNGQVTEGGTKVFGDLNFSTDRLLAAINYADVLTHDQLLYVVKALRARGYNIPSQSVDYAASLINNIRQMQLPKPNQKGFKLGAHKEEFQTGLRVPRAQFSEAGVGNTDAARRHGIWRSTEEPIESEWADYINNIVRYNRFFGPEQGNGGVQTVLSRRPRYTWEKPFDMEGRKFGETIYYDNGKQYENIHALETDLGNDSGFQGRDLINGRNPLLMRTIIAPRDSYFYGQGLKKGGKLLKKNK